MVWGKCSELHSGLDRGRLADVFDAIIRYEPKYPHTIALTRSVWGFELISASGGTKS